jgi:hypothetical protein
VAHRRHHGVDPHQRRARRAGRDVDVTAEDEPVHLERGVPRRRRPGQKS